jgi:hypothetical protein
MKWLVRTVIGVAVLAVVLLAVGMVLPSHFRIERSASINAPADKVYALLVDPREWKRWSVWNQRDAAMKIGTWTNEGEMGGNPINRWFGLMMDRMVGPDFEAGLANLKKLAEAA